MAITAQKLADNISNYTDATILAQKMYENRISLEELISIAGGEFAKKLRDDVRMILESDYEPKDWENCCNNRHKESYADYLKMFPKGAHATEAKEGFENSLSQEELDEARAIWEKVDKKDETSLKEFIDKNPNSPFLKAAKDLLDRIRMKVLLDPEIVKFENDLRESDSAEEVKEVVSKYYQNNPSKKDDIYTLLVQDHNLIHYKGIKLLRDSKLLDPVRLIGIGIDPNFIKSLDLNIQDFTLLSTKKLSPITRKSVEVYFWGIPTSGKTTAISAILGAAGLGKVVKTIDFDNKSQGYEYMNELGEIFKNNKIKPVSFLPPGTNVESTFEMGLTLTDNNLKRHTYTFIDLSGEVLPAMYKTDAEIELSTYHKKVLENANLLLNSKKNTRIHFIVLEYSDKPLEVNGLSADRMLKNALNYIEDKQIFSSGTEAIYLLITKVDKIPGVTSSTSEVDMAVKLRNYLIENFNEFYNKLQLLCKTNHINKGVVEVLPLSLGSVCFKKFCLFNPHYAENVIRAILKHPRRKWFNIF